MNLGTNNKGVSVLVISIIIFLSISFIGVIYYFLNPNSQENNKEIDSNLNTVTSKETTAEVWECDENLYKCLSIKKINEVRKNNNLSELRVNKVLCEQAREIAISISLTEDEQDKSNTRKIEFEKVQEINSKTFNRLRIFSTYPLMVYMREKVWPIWERGEKFNLYNEEEMIKIALDLPDTTTDICIAHPIDGPVFEHKGSEYKFYTPTTVMLLGDKTNP